MNEEEVKEEKKNVYTRGLKRREAHTIAQTDYYYDMCMFIYHIGNSTTVNTRTLTTLLM